MMNSMPVDQNTDIRTTEVTNAMDAILSTDKFMASPQMSAFLRYVVEQTLIGNTRRIKAFTVGIEALGKPASFDPQTDPSVRVLAKRLRSSLDVYYEQNPQTDIFIELKPGSYVPKFLRRAEMNATPAVDLNTAQMGINTTTQPHSMNNEPVLTQQELDRTRGDISHGIATASEELEAALSAPQTSESHVNVAHANTQEPTAHTAETPSLNEQEEENTNIENNLSQLWNAYKSTSKVA